MNPSPLVGEGGARRRREGEGMVPLLRNKLASVGASGATPSPSHCCAMGPFLSHKGRGGF